MATTILCRDGKGKALIELLKKLEQLQIEDHPLRSNIIPITVSNPICPKKFRDILIQKKIFFHQPPEQTARRFTLTINPTILRRTNEEIYEDFKAALESAWVD